MSDQIKFDGLEPPQAEAGTPKSITCCFTGHRNISPGTDLYTTVREEIIKAYRLGYRIFCAGGAMGFDTVAALNTLALRESLYPDIRLIL